MHATDYEFSIIICTRNRHERVKQTVDCILSRLEYFSGARLVIVDNGSTDGTREYLAELAAKHERVVVLYEPTRGLIHARIRGLLYPWGDFYVIVDDDILPNENWPGDLIQELIEDISVGLIGTAVDCIWMTPRPAWFTDWLDKNTWSLDRPGRITCRFPRYPFGNSMAGRRIPEILELYAAPVRKKIPLGWGAASEYGETGGEDWDLSELYIRNGFEVIITDRVRVKHVADMSKLTPEWIYHKFYSDGQLRIRYGRLAKIPVSWRTLIQMLAYPGLWLWAQVLQSINSTGARTVPTVAYSKRAQGMWVELIFGPRHLRFPFQLEEKSYNGTKEADSKFQRE